MRLTVIAIGTRGDVQPYVALGRGLGDAGHSVRIATHPRFEGLVRAHGLDFGPVAEGDLSRGLETDEGRRWVQTTSRRRPGWLGFAKDAASVARRRLADCGHACADADAIVASMWGTLIGFQLADVLGVPLVRAYLTPLGFHAPDDRPGSPLPIELRRRAGRMSQALIRQMLWQASRPWANAARRDVLGLPPLAVREPFGALDARRTPLLYGYSRAVIPRLLEEPAWLQVTGCWLLPEEEAWTPPAALRDFLAAGPPPLLVSFGTREGDDREPVATTRIVLDALARTGRRAVVVRSARALRGVELPSGVLALDFVPHAWILPRVSAAIHHGGAGTTAATLRAGLPSVVVPFYADQPFWARRVHRIGAAPPPIPRRRLTAGRLAEAIGRVTADAALRRAAAAAGARIRTERGVEEAVDAFERHVVTHKEAIPR